MNLKVRYFITEWKLKGKKSRTFMFLGCFFLLLALVGVFLPIIPQVPFAIISAYFFSKGSPVIHLWMRHNRFFGKPIREWETYRIVRPKMKIIASLSLVAGAVMGHWKLDPDEAIFLDAIFFAAIIFVVTRRSRVLNFL